MSKKVKVKTYIPIEGGKVINSFELIVSNDKLSQTFEVEYISQADGGPLMRPKNPPA